MSDYPLCDKYKAPLKDGQLPFDVLGEWVLSLPHDWPEKFSSVCGPVTCRGDGLFADDVEDTLYALLHGLKSRRWNG